jgi:AraC-like DNA-binding protein
VFLVTWKSPQAVGTLPTAMHIHPCAVYTISLHQQQPSTRDISTTMAPIDEDIAFLRSSDQSPIAEVARRFNANRSTLSKQFQGKTGSAKKAGSNQLPSNEQELVLVDYTRRLSNGVYLLHHQWRLSGPLSCVDRSLARTGHQVFVR